MAAKCWEAIPCCTTNCSANFRPLLAEEWKAFLPWWNTSSPVKRFQSYCDGEPTRNRALLERLGPMRTRERKVLSSQTNFSTETQRHGESILLRKVPGWTVYRFALFALIRGLYLFKALVPPGISAPTQRPLTAQ